MVTRHQDQGCGKIPIKGAWFRPRDGIFTQPSKYFSIFKILQYDYALLSLHTLLLYESLRSKNPETIVIVSTGRPQDYCDSSIKHADPPILLSEEIVSLDGSLKTNKPVSYYLKRQYLPTPWCRKARLAYAGHNCRCLLHTCSTIGLLHICRYYMVKLT